MDRSPERAEPGLDRFVGRTVSRLRWTTIAVLLLITLLAPAVGRTGVPIALLILVFGVYNLLVELVRRRRPGLRDFRWIPLVDVPVAAALYSLDHGPNGPVFVLFFLAVITAAATMSLRGVVAYTVATALVAVAVVPTFPWWVRDEWNLRELGARLVVLSLVGIGTSILTRRLALEQEIGRSMRDEAARRDELDRLRTEFVMTVSHDLRTPLTAMRAGLGMLERSAADRLRPDEQQLLGNVRRSVDRLGHHVDDLVTINQIESGTMRLDRQAVDLRSVAMSAVSAVDPLLREKGQPLEIDLPEPLLGDGDAVRLEQAVVNLLANAHRHTPSGTRIAVAGRAEDDAARLSVSDDGPGVPPAEHEAIFRRFHRLPTSGEGSGLGLEIARRIVELHGGRLWVESELGRGATFHIALPRSPGGRPETA